jgi:two-component system response regulator YesN
MLIVDDEPIIVDSLYDMFLHAEDLELDICKAYSGTEALSWMDFARFDIVLTDIEMPEVTGLQLLDEILKRWPECWVILFTGHINFNYIYSATKHERVSYILKNESNHTVIETVKKAISHIEASLQVEELVKQTNKQMEMALPIFRKEYLLDFLYGGGKVEQSQLDKLGINLKEGEPVVLILGRVDSLSGYRFAYEKEHVLYTVCETVLHFLQQRVSGAYLTINRDKILWIFQTANIDDDGSSTKDRWGKTIIFLKGMMEKIQDVCKHSLDISASFVLSCNPVNWEDIPAKNTSLQFLMQFHIGTESGGIFYDDETLSLNKATLRIFISLNRLRLYEANMMACDTEEVYDLIINLLGNAGQLADTNHNLALEILNSIALFCLSYMNQAALRNKMLPSEDIQNLFKINESEPVLDVIKYYKEIIHKVFHTEDKEQNSYSITAVNMVKKFVSDRLNEDLSLIRLADFVHLNPVYLSKLFKQITGANVIEYIIDVRLQKAKEMLRDPHKKIYEIALDVGFNSAPYFTKVFRQIIGMTPQQYRVIILSDNL